MPNWGEGYISFISGKMVHWFLRTNRAKNNDGKSSVAPCFEARTWNLACSTLHVNDVALALFKCIWAGLIVVDVWKPAICTVLGKMYQGERWVFLKMPAPSANRCWSHSGMGDPTTLSRSQCQFPGDIPTPHTVQWYSCMINWIHSSGLKKNPN